ncbi:MAG: hypothetical protein IJ615_10520 [Bacteroidaceae bacterium]|nr:hypothetical protein [Bacteroidaceae bacterium]
MTSEELNELIARTIASAKQVNLLTGDHASAPYYEAGSSPKAELSQEQSQTVSRLKPIFYGNEDEARNFLLRVQDMKAMQITTLVNTLVAERKISDVSCHRELFTVLSESGIYDRSESNWNQQVK